MTTAKSAVPLDNLRFKYTIAMLVIILISAYLRLSWLGVVEFKYDEAMISRRALELVETARWPASTISSIPGIPQPPYKALLLAIPYFVTRNPIIAASFQSLLGVITVALTGWLGRHYFGTRVGIIASLLLATAPWVFFYDRKLWSQNVPLLTIVMMVGLFQAIIDRKPKWIVVSCLAVGLLIGFYLGNAVLAVVVGLSILLYVMTHGQGNHQKFSAITLVWPMVGLLAALTVLYPFALELSQLSPTIEANPIPSTPEYQSDLWSHMLMSATVSTGSQFYSLAGDKLSNFKAQLPSFDIGVFLDNTLVWVTIGGTTYAVGRAIRGGIARNAGSEPEIAYELLSIWIAVPILVWALLNKTAYPHRYIMALPAQFLATAVVLNDLCDLTAMHLHRWRKVVAFIISMWIFALTTMHLILVSSMMDFVSQNVIIGGHGEPASNLWAMVASVNRTGSTSSPVVVYTDGDDPEYDGSAAVVDALLGDRTLYIVSNPDIQVVPVSDYVSVEWHNSEPVLITKQAGEATSTLAGIARFDNGIDLVSVSTTLDGNLPRIRLILRIWADPPDIQGFGYSIQLLDANGTAVTKSDGPFLRAPYWYLGDTIIIEHHLTKHEVAMTSFMFSMYAYESPGQISGVNILDIAGNPAGQQVIVPLK